MSLGSGIRGMEAVNARSRVSRLGVRAGGHRDLSQHLNKILDRQL